MFLVLLSIATTDAQETKFGEWRIAEAPALLPGQVPAWDDFAIGTVSVVKLPDKWAMLYEGIALNEDGRTHSFGIAESADGISWKKRPENPVFEPGDVEWEVASGPSVARWHDAWWMAYVVDRSLAFEEKTPEDFAAMPSELHLARSGDGIVWEHIAKLKNLPINTTGEADLRPCIYAEADKLHMWWLAAGDEGKAALYHAVSSDGEEWPRPNRQPASEIDSRPICCARVSQSGEFYILTYVAHRDQKSPRFVTKISRNARSWQAGGPPEITLGPEAPLAPHWQHPAPAVVFTKEGARLYFIEQRRVNDRGGFHPNDSLRGSVLRTAACAKIDAQN